MTNKVNVTVFKPGASVSTMQDEIESGAVQEAVDAAVTAYLPVDSDGDVEVRSYTEDFDNAVEEAVEFAKTTSGADLLVIITDTESNDRPKAERLLAGVKAGGDMVVIVPVSHQGYDGQWLKQLDADTDEGSNHVDVVSVEDLSNREVAYNEVDQFLATV